jgi:hypothetical protein
MSATSPQPTLDGRVSAAPAGLTERARFEAFYARWFPRVYRFAAQRLADRVRVEIATREALSDAIRSGLTAEGDDAAPLVLALARASLERTRAAHPFVT